MDDTTHKCDEKCVCPVDGKPLFYSTPHNEHACQDSDCVNAHGMVCTLDHDPKPYAELDVSGWQGIYSHWTGQLVFSPREDFCRIEEHYR